MNDAKKTMEPWQLVLILVLILAFFGGLYVTNQSISVKLDAVEQSVNSNKDALRSAVDRLENKMESLHRQVVRPAAVAPAGEPATEPAADE